MPDVLRDYDGKLLIPPLARTAEGCHRSGGAGTRARFPVRLTPRRACADLPSGSASVGVAPVQAALIYPQASDTTGLAQVGHAQIYPQAGLR